MFNSIQIFYNQVFFNSTYNQSMQTGHTFMSPFYSMVDHSLPLFILLVISTILFFLRGPWSSAIRAYFGLTILTKKPEQAEKESLY